MRVAVIPLFAAVLVAGCGAQDASVAISLLPHVDRLLPAYSVVLSASPNTLFANGARSSLISATLSDVSGRPVSGQTLTFTPSDITTFVSPATAITDCSGTARTSFAASSPGQKVLRAGPAGLNLAHLAVNFICAGTFTQPNIWPLTANFPTEVRLVDMNNDRKLDLVVDNAGSGTMAVGLGNANGSFNSFVSRFVAGTPLSFAVADFNSDGNLDVVTGNQNANTISVLLKRAMAALPLP